jgi:sRNA-binding carbon storage regulator CsrA
MSGEVVLEPGQLVLTRRPGEQITLRLSDGVGTITIARVNSGSKAVRIALNFPRSVQIARTELLEGGDGDE